MSPLRKSEEAVMSTECTFKSESVGLAASEFGKLVPPALRAGVLLASIANNVMANPRNAAIVAMIVVVALPICWLWKRRRDRPRAARRPLEEKKALANSRWNLRSEPQRAASAPAATYRPRFLRCAFHAIPARIDMSAANADGESAGAPTTGAGA